MCDALDALGAFLPTLKFVPDLSVMNKMLEALDKLVLS